MLNKYAEEGEWQEWAPLFKVANIDNMTLRVYVTNDQLKDVKLNDRVQVCRPRDESGKKAYEGVRHGYSTNGVYAQNYSDQE